MRKWLRESFLESPLWGRLNKGVPTAFLLALFCLQRPLSNWFTDNIAFLESLFRTAPDCAYQQQSENYIFGVFNHSQSLTAAQTIHKNLLLSNEV